MSSRKISHEQKQMSYEDGLEEIDRRGVGMKSSSSTFGVKAVDIVDNE